MAADRKRVLVGVLGAPHGVRGEMRVKSFTADPAALTRYGELSTEDGRRRFTVESWRPLKDDMAVVRLKGVEDRDAAALLTNQTLFIDRDKLPPPEEDEFYQADLVGLRAETAAGSPIGEVIAIQNFGAGDLLEIRPAQGATILVSFTRSFVPVVDVPGRRVVVADEALDEGEAEHVGEDPAAGNAP